MYRITIRIQAINEDNGRVQVDRIYERKVPLLATVLQISSNIAKVVLKAMDGFTEI